MPIKGTPWMSLLPPQPGTQTGTTQTHGNMLNQKLPKQPMQSMTKMPGPMPMPKNTTDRAQSTHWELPTKIKLNGV